MSVYIWKFNVIPDPREVEMFIELQMPLFARNARHLTGADGRPVVDLMRVEHNCGEVNLEFELNGVEGRAAMSFVFRDITRAIWTMKATSCSIVVIRETITTGRLWMRFKLRPEGI